LPTLPTPTGIRAPSKARKPKSLIAFKGQLLYTAATAGPSQSQPTTPPPKPPKEAAKPKPKTLAKKMDHRIFIRATGYAGENHPHAVRAKVAAIVPEAVKDLRKVPSGFAIVPKDKAAAEALLKNRKEIEIVTGGRLEEARNWHTYILGQVPIAITTYESVEWDQGVETSVVQVTEKLLTDEAFERTGLLPVRVAWGKKTNAN